MSHATATVARKPANARAPTSSKAGAARRARVGRAPSELALRSVTRPRLTSAVQAKLEVNRPDDPFEREADAMAERVVTMPIPAPGPIANAQNPRHIQRQETDIEEEAVQRAPAGSRPVPTISPVTADTIRHPGAGRALPTVVRSRIEPQPSADLSGARVHEGTAADQAAQRLDARAFTHGSDIFLSRRAASTDLRLMAHEATHVVQQGGAVRRQADEGETVQRQPHGEETIQRTTEPEQVQRATAAGEPLQRATGEPPAVQRSLWSDITGVAGAVWDATGGRLVDAAGNLLEMGADFFWGVIDRLAPSLASVLREISRRGIVGYLSDLISGAMDRLFGALGVDPAFIAGIIETFNGLLGTARDILAALASGNCEPLFAAVRALRDTVQRMASEAWDAIVDFFRPVGEFFSNLWNRFGAPAIDWLSEVAGNIWQGIQNLGRQIWEWTEPVRAAIGQAWTWIKNQLGIGEGAEGQNGLLQWVQEKAREAWGWIREQLAPVIEPIRGVIDRITAILPLTAIMNLRETITGWLNNTQRMVGAMEQEDGVVQSQTSLRDEILPAVLETIRGFRASLVSARGWVAGQIGSLATAIATFLDGLQSNPIVGAFAGALAWLRGAVGSLAGWAQGAVVNLFTFVGDGLVRLSRFIEPVLNVLQRVVAVIGDVVSELPNLVLGPLWRIIPACIRNPIKKFIVEHILSHIPIFGQLMQIPDIWSRVSETAMRILRQVFVNGDLLAAAWTFFRALLNLVGIPARLVTGIITKAAAALSDILTDPIGFLTNLLRALREGFVRFFDNIWTHLLSGVAGWLFGQMSDAGITPPQDLSFRSILGVILQILDITVDRVFQRLERRIGRERAQRLRRLLDIATGVWNFVARLVREGPAGLWEALQEQLSNLWEIVRNGVISWLTQTIITRVTARLLSMLDPTGIMAVVNSLIAVYRAIQSALDYLRQMLEIVDRVLDGITGIARGAIQQAAGFLENALARAIPVAIGFLANQVGLRNLSTRMGEMVEGVRARVDRAIDWLINRAIRAGQAVLRSLGRGGRREGRGAAGVRTASAVGRPVRFSAGGEGHRLWVRSAGRDAVVMIASQETSLDRFLARREVQALKANDPQNHVTGAERLTREADVDADAVLNLLARQAGNQAQSKEDEVNQDLQNLATHLRWILDRLDEFRPDYPRVGTYAALSGVANYTPHHIPPKALANWIYRQITSIPRDIRTLTGVQPVVTAGRRGKVEHDGGGRNLSSILIHTNTHIRRTGDPALDAYRAHHGARVSELVAADLRNRGVTPIPRLGGRQTLPEDIAQERAATQAGGADRVRPGMPSTQFYQRELDAARGDVRIQQRSHVTAFLASVRGVFSRAHQQSRAAVRAALANSVGKDGPPERQQAAMTELESESRSTWRSAYGSGADDLTQF